MFFYMLNAYKHVQPGISGRNKHMLSILASLETSSLLFSCLKSWFLVLIRHVTGRFVYVSTVLLT